MPGRSAEAPVERAAAARMNPTLPIQNRGAPPTLLASPASSHRSVPQAQAGGLWAQQVLTSSGAPKAWADYTPTPGAQAVGSFKFHTSGNFTQSGRLQPVAQASPQSPPLLSDDAMAMKKVDSNGIPQTPSRVWPQTPDAMIMPNPFARPTTGSSNSSLQAPPQEQPEARDLAGLKLAAGRQILTEAFRVKNTFIELDSDDDDEPEIGVPRGQSAPVIPTRATGSLSGLQNRPQVIPMGSITESDVGQQVEPPAPAPAPAPAAAPVPAPVAPALAPPYVAPYRPPATGPVNGLPSKGSAQHGTGKCRPCAWFFKEQGCSNDFECGYCHVCPEGELKARKKSKVTAMRMGALAPAKAGMPSGPRTLKLAPMLDVM